MSEALLPCQQLFGRERGDAIRQQVEKMTGEACPCAAEGWCLLLPPSTPIPAQVS